VAGGGKPKGLDFATKTTTPKPPIKIAWGVVFFFRIALFHCVLC